MVCELHFTPVLDNPEVCPCQHSRDIYESRTGWRCLCCFGLAPAEEGG